MAWLELEPSGVYHIAFRFGDQKFKKSLKTTDEDEAEARRHRLEENIRLVESGRMSIPEKGDVGIFLLSDGHLNGKPKAPKRIDLGKLFETYQGVLPKDAMEPESLRITGVHMGHFARILGSRKNLRTISSEDLQTYVTTRSKEPGKRGRCVSVGTIKKELGTFRSFWGWARTREFVGDDFPKNGLKYPKLDEKPPFQTWAQIERQIRLSGATGPEEADLWDCLYLSSAELDDLLEHVKKVSPYGFLYPMCFLAAHTGARRSELSRSRAEDVDLEGGNVLIRERKRAKGRRTTRFVPLTPQLRSILTTWFAERPASPFTFPEDHRVARNRKSRPTEGCVTPDEASHHLDLVLAGSKWEKIRGWHIFRHSFISNCAAKGVDQRMIDSWTGHQTDEMRRRYTHLFPHVQDQAIRQVFARQVAQDRGVLAE